MGRFARLAAFVLACTFTFSPLVAFADAEGEHADGAHTAEPVADVHDAKHDEHADDAHGGPLTLGGVLSDREFLGAVVNFTVLLVILGFATKKIVNPSLAGRRTEVIKDLAEAKRLKQAAAEKHAEYQSRLDKLDSEVDQIRAEMITAGEVERDRIVAEAEENATRLRKDTSFMIEQQMKQLRHDLTREAAQAAVAAAEGLLVNETKGTDQDRLADAYLSKLDEVTGEAAS